MNKVSSLEWPIIISVMKLYAWRDRVCIIMSFMSKWKVSRFGRFFSYLFLLWPSNPILSKATIWYMDTSQSDDKPVEDTSYFLAGNFSIWTCVHWVIWEYQSNPVTHCTARFLTTVNPNYRWPPSYANPYSHRKNWQRLHGFHHKRTIVLLFLLLLLQHKADGIMAFVALNNLSVYQNITNFEISKIEQQIDTFFGIFYLLAPINPHLSLFSKYAHIFIRQNICLWQNITN